MPPKVPCSLRAQYSPAYEKEPRPRRVEYGDERDPKMHEYLERIAPMNNIEKIKKAMLVIAGKNDPRVPVSESSKKAGNTCLVHQLGLPML